MTEPDFFHQVFLSLPRQGPGYSEATKKAWSMIPALPVHPNILDIGCGTGTPTRDLAAISGGTITAVDNYQPFLDKVADWVIEGGLSERIHTRQASMDDLPFGKEEFDVIWSEGAIDIMGFEKGLVYWQDFLKKGGYIVVSDLTFFTEKGPEELIEFWKPYGVTVFNEKEKAKQVEETGLKLIGMFRLEEKGWLEHYYEPMRNVIAGIRKKHGDNPECSAIMDALSSEDVMYQKYGKLYGYTFFIMQKP